MPAFGPHLSLSFTITYPKTWQEKAIRRFFLRNRKANAAAVICKKPQKPSHLAASLEEH